MNGMTLAALLLAAFAFAGWATEIRLRRAQLAQMRAHIDAAFDHAEDAQMLLDAIIGDARDDAARRHPSRLPAPNVRVLKAVD